MKQLSIYETDYLEDLNTINHFERQHTQQAAECLVLEPALKENSETSTPEFAPNVTEIIIAKHKADSIQMILPMLSKLNQEQRWLAWIDPPTQLLKKWQEEHESLAMEEIMILRSSDSISSVELSKRALEAGTCHSVIAWTDALSGEEFESLENASSIGNSHGIILRAR
jgi:cell division inhibitor SulA